MSQIAQQSDDLLRHFVIIYQAFEIILTTMWSTLTQRLQG